MLPIYRACTKFDQSCFLKFGTPCAITPPKSICQIIQDYSAFTPNHPAYGV